MKKSILILVPFLLIQFMHGQEMDSLTSQTNQEKYDFHFLKHKKQKKTGLIMLGSGVVVAGAGILIARNSNILGDDAEGFEAGTGLALVGSLTTVASIPVLISSGVHKRKTSLYVNVTGREILDMSSSRIDLATVGVKIEF